jgi:ribosome-associated protein
LDKKGGDVLLLDLRETAIFTDYFLICNGESDRQLKALATSIADEAKEKADSIPWGLEGESANGWVLLDYGSLIVHLFSPAMRKYYNLEELWHDAHVILRMQ